MGWQKRENLKRKPARLSHDFYGIFRVFFSLKPINWGWFLNPTPLKKIWVRQLGVWKLPEIWKKKKCSKPPPKKWIGMGDWTIKNVGFTEVLHPKMWKLWRTVVWKINRLVEGKNLKRKPWLLKPPGFSCKGSHHPSLWFQLGIVRDDLIKRGLTCSRSQKHRWQTGHQQNSSKWYQPWNSPDVLILKCLYRCTSMVRPRHQPHLESSAASSKASRLFCSHQIFEKIAIIFPNIKRSKRSGYYSQMAVNFMVVKHGGHVFWDPFTTPPWRRSGAAGPGSRWWNFFKVVPQFVNAKWVGGFITSITMDYRWYSDRSLVHHD